MSTRKHGEGWHGTTVNPLPPCCMNHHLPLVLFHHQQIFHIDNDFKESRAAVCWPAFDGFQDPHCVKGSGWSNSIFLSQRRNCLETVVVWIFASASSIGIDCAQTEIDIWSFSLDLSTVPWVNKLLQEDAFWIKINKSLVLSWKWPENSSLCLPGSHLVATPTFKVDLTSS